MPHPSVALHATQDRGWLGSRFLLVHPPWNTQPRSQEGQRNEKRYRPNTPAPMTLGDKDSDTLGQVIHHTGPKETSSAIRVSAVQLQSF